jgi:hypothetical protein
VLAKKMHRGWIKVLIAANVKSEETTAIGFTDEKAEDGRMFGPLIDQPIYNLKSRD